MSDAYTASSMLSITAVGTGVVQAALCGYSGLTYGLNLALMAADPQGFQPEVFGFYAVFGTVQAIGGLFTVACAALLAVASKRILEEDGTGIEVVAAVVAVLLPLAKLGLSLMTCNCIAVFPWTVLLFLGAASAATVFSVRGAREGAAAG